jgi:hypothetical protein
LFTPYIKLISGSFSITGEPSQLQRSGETSI